MDNLVFERDYSKSVEKMSDSNQDDEKFLQVISDGFLKNYFDALNAFPKVVISEYQANYEYVLRICDELARRWGGSIHGVVNYEKWEATINVVIPYVEFTSPEELQNLREIAEKSHGVSIQPADGGICIQIYNRYFEDLISDAQKSYIAYKCIVNDKELSERLELSTELHPEYQRIAEYLSEFLDEAEKVTGRNRTDILKDFLFRVSNADEVENIYDAMKNVAQDMINESGLK